MKRLNLRRWNAPILVTVAVVGVVSGSLKDWRAVFPASGPGGLPRDLDYYAGSRSFSEIETARAELEGLALRYRAETRQKQMEGWDRSGFSTEARQAAIADLEKGIAEFRDTPEELILVQDLLLLLRAEGQHHRWLDVYLDVLYRRPTHAVLATFLRNAIEAGERTGREDEVAAGLRHLREIPLEFPAKHLLQDYESHVARSTAPASDVL